MMYDIIKKVNYHDEKNKKGQNNGGKEKHNLHKEAC